MLTRRQEVPLAFLPHLRFNISNVNFVSLHDVWCVSQGTDTNHAIVISFRGLLSRLVKLGVICRLSELSVVLVNSSLASQSAFSDHSQN